jgi:hypothetical protein
MAYNRNQVAGLLSATEMELFVASLAGPIVELDAAALRSQIRRTRTLRDKSQDLLQRQRLATRDRTGTKSGQSGVANERTAQKVKAFAETLQRFENRLGLLEAREAREAARAHSLRGQPRAGRVPGAAGHRPLRSPKAPAIAPQGGPAGPGATSEGARSARHAKQFEASRSKAIQGHLSSRGRTSQARRDQRGGGKG